MQERRKAPRAPFTGWVEITVGASRRRANGRDLAAGGMSIASRPPLAIRTPIVSEFALPGISLPLALEGVVVWSDGEQGCFGVRFDGIDAGLAELLESYIAGSL